jgi:hypothetical protein
MQTHPQTEDRKGDKEDLIFPLPCTGPISYCLKTERAQSHIRLAHIRLERGALTFLPCMSLILRACQLIVPYHNPMILGF